MKSINGSADLVREYLSTVELEASVLPADRRQELLADLAEHIEVTRAERPDAPIGTILAELGDPRTIAATALTEAGIEAVGSRTPTGAGAPRSPQGKVHPLVPLLMLTLPLLLTALLPDVPGLPACCTLLRITGAVLLCTSVHWTAGRKTTGVLVTAVLPTVAAAVWAWSGAAPEGETPALVANLAMFALLVGATAWLWRVRRT